MSKRGVFLLSLVVGLSQASVWADGCFVWRRGADLNEPSQKAAIYWDGKTETLVLAVKYEGLAEDFAWVVPVPSRPQVAAIEAGKSPFAELSLYTQLRSRWGSRERIDKGEPGGAVTVLERKTVGVYDVAVLAARDAGALSKWLNANGYAFPERRGDVLGHYTRKGWFYVAMRIDRKALGRAEVGKLKVGELQAVRLRFASERMVYPLRISSVNAGRTEVLLYLLAETAMVLAGKDPRPGFAIERNVPGFLRSEYLDARTGTFRKVTGKELPLTWQALGLAKEVPLALCKYRSVYKTEEMTDDLAFERFDPAPYWEKRLEAARHWQTKLAIVRLLMQHDEARYGKRLVALLGEWAASADVSARKRAAANPAAAPALLTRLARDAEPGVRSAVAANPHTPAEVLTRLSDDRHEGVRGFIARNPAAGQGLLRVLARDRSQAVAYAAIGNPRLPVEALRELVRDGPPQLRPWIAGQKRCPSDLLGA